MNIINKLTLRHLKENKRRTLVTIIGVIISVAMVMAVATLGVSFLDLMKRQTIANEGEWHVLYQNVNKDQLDAIKNDEATKNFVLSRDLGYAHLEGSQNENKPYLFIKEYNAPGFKQFPIELSEGRLPQTAKEVVISEEIKNNAKVDYEIGQQITLDIGDRFMKDEEASHIVLNQTSSLTFMDDQLNEELKKKGTETFTVVGIIKRPTWEPAWAPGYTIITYLDESKIGEKETVNATVVLKKSINPYMHMQKA